MWGGSIVVVQSLSYVQLFVTPWTAVHWNILSFTISQSLLKLMSIELVMPSNCLIVCHPLLLLPSIFPSIRVFSNELALHIRWPKYWSLSFSISPSNEYSGLISFRIDWLDLLAVQGSLKNLLQHNSKALIFRHSAFFMVQLSHPYIDHWKTHLFFSCSVTSDSLQAHGLQHARLPCPSLSPSLPKLMSIESMMPSNHLTLCYPLLLLPSIFPSIRVFSNESILHIR